MAILSFFRPIRNKRFDYTPLYYDERKERMKERLAEAERNNNPDAGDYIPNISGKMRSKYKKDDIVHKNKASNIRIMIIIALLVAGVYYFFVK